MLIVENGAQKFALDNGIQTLPPGSLVARESVTSQDSGEEGVCSFESCTAICRTQNSNDDARNASEVKSFTEGEAISCDSECVLIRSCGGEAPPCYALSIDSEDMMDASTILQVCFTISFRDSSIVYTVMIRWTGQDLCSIVVTFDPRQTKVYATISHLMRN